MWLNVFVCLFLLLLLLLLGFFGGVFCCCFLILFFIKDKGYIIAMFVDFVFLIVVVSALGNVIKYN